MASAVTPPEPIVPDSEPSASLPGPLALDPSSILSPPKQVRQGSSLRVFCIQQRRTMADLASLFEGLGTTAPETPGGTRSAPLRLLPELIDKFEQLRNVTLLGEHEKDQLVSPCLSCSPAGEGRAS